MKKYLFILIIGFCVNFLSISIVLADKTLKYELIEPLPLVKKNTDFPHYLESLFKLTIATIVIVALLMIVIGGYYYIISAGNQSKISSAKEIIWNSILGLVVVMFIGILFYTINSDILKFKPSFPEKMKVD